MSTPNKMLQNAVKTDAGITLNGIVLKPVVEKCEGCERVREFEEQQFCQAYPNPERKWLSDRCNFATHIKVTTKASAKVNPLKASKRAAKGK